LAAGTARVRENGLFGQSPEKLWHPNTCPHQHIQPTIGGRCLPAQGLGRTHSGSVGGAPRAASGRSRRPWYGPPLREESRGGGGELEKSVRGRRGGEEEGGGVRGRRGGGGGGEQRRRGGGEECKGECKWIE
jgi:hypothetical protein